MPLFKGNRDSSMPSYRRRPSPITLADQARDSGRFDEAARLYRLALSRNPQRPPIWVQLGHVLKESGDLRASEHAYRQALVGGPVTADAFLQLGHCLKLQGKTEEAQAAYLRAFALGSSGDGALTELEELGWSRQEMVELVAVSQSSCTPAWSDYDAPIDVATVSVDEEARGDTQLHFYIDEVSVDEFLRIRGWIFHVSKKITSIRARLKSSMGYAVSSAGARYARSDVSTRWGLGKFEQPGFTIDGLDLSPRGPNKVALEIEMEESDGIIIEVAELFVADSQWRMKCLSDCCTRTLNVAGSSGTPSDGDIGGFKTRTLADALSLLSLAPLFPPKLVEPVSILVSVYEGVQYLTPFFTSLLDTTPSECPIVIIDNGNTDGRISAYLRALASGYNNIKLVCVEKNLGYVGAMCLAITHSLPSQHVVVLNTDLVLPPNWLERLMEPIFKDSSVGSVTPLTNAGTVCSFPKIGIDNPLHLGLSAATIDAEFARVQAEKCLVKLPSGVGFCMAHNRAAVDQVGWYDLDAFGRGYGEENDWCLRAARAGFDNILAPNLFVYHKHGGIYGEEKEGLLAKSLSVIDLRYPFYRDQVENFFRRDPLRLLRAVVAFALAARHSDRACILILDHSRGGGSNFFRDRLVAGLTAQGHCAAVVTWSQGGTTFKIDLLYGSERETMRAPDLSSIAGFLRYVRFHEVVINNLVDIPDIRSSIDSIIELVKMYNLRLKVYIHDYFSICPSLNLLNDTSRFCEIPALNTCAACWPRNDNFSLDLSSKSGFTIASWRSKMENILQLSNDIVCFSRESSERIKKVYPSVAHALKVFPHFVDYFQVPSDFAVPTHDDMCIGVVGSLSTAKGSRIVLGLAEAIRARVSDERRLVVIGNLDLDITNQKVMVTGSYDLRSLPALLEQHRVNLVFLPSLWPETFCYVAEEVMSLGLPLVVFDIGAPAERVAHYAKGAVLPSCEGEVLLEALSAFWMALHCEGDVKDDVQQLT